MMRGHRLLKASKKLGRIAGVKRALTTERLGINTRELSSYILGESVTKGELIVRQYLLIRAAGVNLNRALLYASAKKDSLVVHFLPPEWRRAVEEHGFKVARVRTALMWQSFVGMMLAYGILSMVKVLAEGLRAACSRLARNYGAYVYFHDLASGNLPNPCRDGRSHDIVSWYIQWPGRIQKIDTICHGVMGAGKKFVGFTPLAFMSSPIPALNHFGALSRFALWSLGACIIATSDFLRGRWWHSLMLNQATLAAKVRLLNSERLAREYLFHNSGWIYRPIWTFEAEKKGARVVFYFYSTNCEDFKRTENHAPISYGWQAMDWPVYLVWDENQAEFVRRAVGAKANVIIAGPIWFHTGAVEMAEFTGRGVAVFDVTPHRFSSYRTLAPEWDYYVPQTCIPFLRDIQQISAKNGFVMLWKRKRKIGSFAHPWYRRFAVKITKAGNVVEVNPDISAVRLIERSSVVISIPFTSTALIARALGKPTCYYDPNSFVRRDDPAAHGIKIIRGPQELDEWLKIAALADPAQFEVRQQTGQSYLRRNFRSGQC